MDENRNDDFDFWKFLLDTFSSYDEDGDEKIKKEEPKKEVKTEKKEEKEEKEKKKEEPKNTNFRNASLSVTSDNPVDLDWLLKPGRQKTEPAKKEPSNTEANKNNTCSVNISRLWDLHKSLSETVKLMNELTESIESTSARWMKLKDGIYSCNSCGKYFTQEYNYCPNCGRKMYKSLTAGGMIFGA